MNGINSYEGNSVIALHDQAEARRDAILECDEDKGTKCKGCDSLVLDMEVLATCKATGTESTAYCICKGKAGCLFKITGRCQSFKVTGSRCPYCGEIQ